MSAYYDQDPDWLPLTGWARKGNPSSFRVDLDASGGGIAAAAPAAPSPSWAVGAAVAGQLSQAYASFAAARSAQREARAQASAYGHRARMLAFDRAAAMRQADSILDQGRSEIGNLTLEGAQRRAAVAAATAGRGIDASVGNAAEVAAADRFADRMDAYHINLGAVRAANAARRGAVAIDNEARFARASATNLRRAARAAAPEAELAMGAVNAAAAGYRVASYRRS